jgi:hypothetical protein
MPAKGHPDEWVKARLAELGLTEDDIGMVTEGAGGLHAQGTRWWICPNCKSNIDFLVWIRGRQDTTEWPKLLVRGEVECPNCGTYGESFGKNAMNEPHPKLSTFKAKRIHNPYPWATRYVRLGKSIVEKNNLFPADPDFDPNEPHWPRDLGSCIVGAAIIIASTIQKQGKSRFDKSDHGSRKFSNRSKGSSRRPEPNGNKKSRGAGRDGWPAYGTSGPKEDQAR